MNHFEFFDRYPSTPQPEYDQTEWQQVEENCWFYYLAEIALRRMTDEIVATMFSSQPWNFSDPQYRSTNINSKGVQDAVRFMVPIPTAINSISAFSAAYGERASVLSSVSVFPDLRASSQAFFFCYTIHNATSAGVEVREMAEAGLSYALDYLLQSNHIHRHHGKWLQLRRELHHSCTLLAAYPSNLQMPQEWQDGVIRANMYMRYWSREAPSFNSHVYVLSVAEEFFLGHRIGQDSESNFKNINNVAAED